MEILPGKAYHVKANGSIKEISPKNGKEFTLEEAQQLVEGYIEIVYLNKRLIMIVNEEGKFGKAPNVIATGIANQHQALWNGDYVCGDAVICPSRMLT